MTSSLRSHRFVAAMVRSILPLYPYRVRLRHGDEIVLAATTEWAARRGAGGRLEFAVWVLVDIARARRDAAVDLAGLSRPSTLRQRGIDTMETLLRECRHAFRALVRLPAFSLTAAITLALGIGATVAVFSVVDAVLLRPLGYPQPERLVALSHGVPGIATGEWGLSRAGYFYFRDHATTLDDIGVYSGSSPVITGEGAPQRLTGARVTWSVLTTLGVVPEIGRPFTIDDDTPGAAPVAIISHGLWTRSFGSDPGVIGRGVQLSGTEHEIVGVMPRSFAFPSAATELWVPSRFDPTATPVNQHTYPGIARLREGVSLEEARGELTALVGRFPEELPPAYTEEFFEESGFHVIGRPLLEVTVGGVRTLLWIVLAASAIVLIIACANVANLMMLRSEGRRQEIAVRAALGAGRAALVRYALSEAVVLATAGGLAGVVIAWAGIKALVAAAPPGLPRLEEIGMRPAALLVACTAAALSAILLGGASSLRSGTRLADQLKHRSSGAAADRGRLRLRLRGALVVTQVAMALVLMAGSGVLFRSFMKLRAVDPGFRVENVLTLQLSISPTRYETPESSVAFFEAVAERFRTIPGVTAAGPVTGLPLASRAWDNANGLADLPDGEAEMVALFDTKFAGPGYLEAMGMRLLEGRMFGPADMRSETSGAIVTRALAEEYWPGQSALGKRIRPLLRDYPWHRIVGVIEDVRTEDITRAPESTVYFPYTDVIWNRSFSFAIRADVDPEPLLPLVRNAVWELDPDVPLASVATMETLVAAHFSRTTLTLTLLGVAAAIALLLGAVGIYGVISFAVSRRYFEIGVRMALGAGRSQVAGMVLGQTMVLAAVGIVVGLVAATAAMRLMGSLLFEVSPSDPLTLAAVAVGLGVVAAIAGALPARRATRVDAVVALRRD